MNYTGKCLDYVSGKLGKHCKIQVHTCVEEGSFKLNRFHVGKNNIRSQWYQGKAQKDDNREGWWLTKWDKVIPVYLLKNTWKNGSVKLYFIIVKVPLIRFSLEAGLIYNSYFFIIVFSFSESSQPSTPHYNMVILQDLVMERHLEALHGTIQDSAGIKEGIVLLNVWLTQRELNLVRLIGCFCVAVSTRIAGHIPTMCFLFHSTIMVEIDRRIVPFCAKS